MAEPTDDITAQRIRERLLARAAAFSERTGLSFSTISKEAVKDDRFLARAKQGANFTIETYQRVIDWIDAAEAPRKRKTPQQTASAA